MENKTSPILTKTNVDKFYDIYKNELLNTHQENLISNFKEQINKLNELEIIIARLEKYNPNNVDLENYQTYISTAKKLLEDNELKLNEENLRNMTFLKYFLSLKLAFFCRKVKMFNEEAYFKNYNEKLELSYLLNKVKLLKRTELYEDVLLEAMFDEERKKETGLIRRYFKWGGFILILGLMMGGYLIYRNKLNLFRRR